MQGKDHNSLRIADLIAKFLKGELSIEETEELDLWLNADPANKELFAELNDPELQKKDFKELCSKDLNSDWNKVSLQIEKHKKTRTHAYKWWAVAATTFLVFSIAGWWFLGRKNAVSKNGSTAKIQEQEIYPGSYTAVLVDGKNISHHLQQNNTDTIGGYAINTVNGLIYIQENNVRDSNTLIVPIKGMFHLMLQDGTEVWLQPSSTLKYPVSFSGSQRRVELNGEAYFKVAKNASMPFRVYCKGVTTEAVGTEFNINGYDNLVTTSLVNGVVHIVTNKGATTMTAGNSIQASAETVPQNSTQLDTSVASGWKNGDFVFRKTKLTDVMSTLAAWYGVETSFSSGYDFTNKTFSGKIPRNIPLSDVLEILTMTNIARFKVQNKTVYVSPDQANAR